jgi:hypothetical protein
MRQSTYSEDLVEEILRRMGEGESLRSICRADGMPSHSVVHGWVRQDRDGLAVRYALARELQAHALADELLEIADDGSNDWMLRNDPNNPGYVENGEHLQRSRLRIDARKWLTSKILPKNYGDRQQVEAAVTVVKGGIDAPPRPSTIEDAEQWLIRRRKELAELDGPPAEQPQASPRHDAPVRPSNYEPRFPSNEPAPSQHEPPHTPRYPEPRWPSTPQPPPPRPQPTTGWTQQQEAEWRRREEQDEQRREIGFRMPRLPR